MPKQRVHVMDRLEWLFPLRGKWLRRCFAGVAWVLGLLFALHYWSLRDILPTVATADPQFTKVALDDRWAWGAYGGNVAGRPHQLRPGCRSTASALACSGLCVLLGLLAYRRLHGPD